jgi:predicted metalloprotease
VKLGPHLALLDVMVRSDTKSFFGVTFSTLLLFFCLSFSFKKRGFIMRRHKLGRKHSRKMFTKYAKKVSRRNVHATPMRGGIRF